MEQGNTISIFPRETPQRAECGPHRSEACSALNTFLSTHLGVDVPHAVKDGSPDLTCLPPSRVALVGAEHLRWVRVGGCI
eukprot:1160418-Pelagomonas_calceolata.AAC.10